MSVVGATIRSLVIGAGFFGGVLAVASCQQDGGHPRDAAAGFMAQSSFGLHYVDMGDAAKLAYGKADSDTVSLMLECAKGSRVIELSDVARGDAGRLSLRADGQRTTFRTRIERGEGSPVVLARAPSETAALKGFRQTGAVEVTNGALTYDVRATRTEKASVERFFNACESAA